jgi:nucleoid-associated protein YgaU
MKFTRSACAVLAILLVLTAGTVNAQDKMSKDQWQQEVNRYSQMRTDLNAKVKDLTTKIATLQAQSTSLDGDLKKCMDELYALVGSDADKAAAYRSEIEAAENNANDLQKLSDADLMERSGDVAELSSKVKNLWGNKLSLIPEFYDRLTALNEKVKSLQNAVGGTGKLYTVGTWRHDRDCLWNISKKKDIYDNAWMWPKIWQGNRDQIKDPDVIQPGQKLKIPKAGPMNTEEKAAAKSYYRKKAG